MSNTDKKILEAVIKLQDNFSKPLQQAQKTLQSFKKSTEGASKTISGLQRIMSKIKPLILAAKDKASPVISKVKGVLKSITSKVWSAAVKIKDMASSALSKIKGLLAGLAAGVTVGVKVGLEGLGQEQSNKILLNRVLKNAGLKDFKKVGNEYYKYLEDYANATPFTTSEVTTIGTKAMLMAKGNMKDAKTILDLISNTKVAVGENRTMQEVVEAYQSAQTGNMESLNNMLNTNYKSFAEAQTRVLKDYGGLVEEYARTIPGLFSTIKGNVQTLLKNMTKPFGDMIANTSQNVIKFFDKMTPKAIKFAQDVAGAFKAFSKTKEANNLLQLFKTVFETVWNAAKAVIDAVSPTIKDIFTWIADHSEQIKGIVQKLGKIWNNVWGAVGPLLQAAWAILKPILSSFLDALESVLWVAEKVSKALEIVANGFKNIANAWKNGDVQKALSNSNAGNGNNTYQATFGGTRAMGQSYVPRNNMLYNLHMGEAILSRRDADQWRKGKGNSTVTIAKIADTVVIREEADLDKFAEKFVRKINQQRIVMG